MNEDLSNKSASEVAVKQEQDIRAISKEIDFKPYLDAVNNAAQRTRSLLYLMIVALIAIFTAYRITTSPDWLDARIARLQAACICVEDGNLSKDGCKESINYATSFLFQFPDTIFTPSLIPEKDATGTTSEGKSDPALNMAGESHTPLHDSEALRELKVQINEMLKQRSELLTIHVPLFGVTLDMNDLGMVSGITLMVLMFLVYVSMLREADNLKRAKRIGQETNNPNNLELLLMQQVLSTPANIRAGSNLLLYVVFVFPAVLQFRIFLTDIQTTKTGQLLEGHWKWMVDMSVEGISLLLILLLTWLCSIGLKQVNKELEGLPSSFPQRDEPEKALFKRD